MRIAEIPLLEGSEVTTVSPGSPAGEAIGLPHERRFGASPVGERVTTLAGTVDERDIVRALAPGTGGSRGTEIERRRMDAHIASRTFD